MRMLPEVKPTEGRTGKRMGQIRFMASGIQFLRAKRKQGIAAQKFAANLSKRIESTKPK